MATFRYLVNDVDSALGFYTGLLAFSIKERWGPALAIVSNGDVDLWLSGPNTSAARPMPDGRRPEPGGWNRFVVTVDDIEATVARLKAAGAAFRNDIISGPGGRQTLVNDPSGNPVELFQPG